MVESKDKPLNDWQIVHDVIQKSFRSRKTAHDEDMLHKFQSDGRGNSAHRCTAFQRLHQHPCVNLALVDISTSFLPETSSANGVYVHAYEFTLKISRVMLYRFLTQLGRFTTTETVRG